MGTAVGMSRDLQSSRDETGSRFEHRPASEVARLARGHSTDHGIRTAAPGGIGPTTSGEPDLTSVPGRARTHARARWRPDCRLPSADGPREPRSALRCRRPRLIGLGRGERSRGRRASRRRIALVKRGLAAARGWTGPRAWCARGARPGGGAGSTSRINRDHRRGGARETPAGPSRDALPMARRPGRSRRRRATRRRDRSRRPGSALRSGRVILGSHGGFPHREKVTRCRCTRIKGGSEPPGRAPLAPRASRDSSDRRSERGPSLWRTSYPSRSMTTMAWSPGRIGT